MTAPPTNKELFRLASLIGCEPENEKRHREALQSYIDQQIIKELERLENEFNFSGASIWPREKITKRIKELKDGR